MFWKRKSAKSTLASTYRRDLAPLVLTDPDEVLASAGRAGGEAAGHLYPDADVGATPPSGALVLVAQGERELATIERFADDDVARGEAELQRRTAKWRHRRRVLGRRANEERRLRRSLRKQQTIIGQHDHHRTNEGRFTLVGMAGGGVLVVIAVAEALFSYVVLSLLGASRPITWGATFAVGIAQLLASHFLGAERSQARRRAADHDGQGADLLLVVVVGIGLVLTVLFMAALRATVLRNDQQTLAATTPGFVAVSPIAAVVLFSALQGLFDGVAFIIGAKRHSPAIEGMKQTSARRTRVHLLRVLLERRASRSETARRACVARLAGRYDELVAWGEEVVKVWAAGIQAFYDGLVSNAPPDTAAAVNEQARPAIAAVPWFDKYRTRASALRAGLDDSKAPGPGASHISPDTVPSAPISSNGDEPVTPVTNT